MTNTTISSDGETHVNSWRRAWEERSPGTLVCALPTRRTASGVTGSVAGYQRHLTIGQPACTPCRMANQIKTRNWRRENPDYVQPAPRSKEHSTPEAIGSASTSAPISDWRSTSNAVGDQMALHLVFEANQR